MNERIKALRKKLGMTQAEFSSKIGLSRNFIAQIETGAKLPSDRTISDICKKFRVSEIWLRTGYGDPIIKLTRNQEITEFANKIMELPDADIKKKMVLALSKLTEDDWNSLINRALEIFEEIEKEGGGK